MVEQFFRRTLKYKEKDLDEIQVLQLTDSQMPSDAYVHLVFGIITYGRSESSISPDTD
jgi:hypothetical protein